MEITVKQDDELTLVELSGELDGKTAPAAQEQVLTLIKPGTHLLLDMSEVAFMSSAGLRMMLLLHRQISAKNGRIVLAGLREEIEDTMELTGFLRHFATVGTVDEGRAMLSEE